MKIVVIIFTISLYLCIHVRIQLVLIMVGFLEGPVGYSCDCAATEINSPALSVSHFFTLSDNRLTWQPKV